MSRLANISSKDAIKAFRKTGWEPRRKPGKKHIVMTKPGIKAILSIPPYDELAIGTLRSLIKDAGLKVEEFLTLLKK